VIRGCLVEQDLGIAGIQLQRFGEGIERLARAAGIQIDKRLAEDGVWRLGVVRDCELRVPLQSVGIPANVHIQEHIGMYTYMQPDVYWLNRLI
jgi:hypothetical protein